MTRKGKVREVKGPLVIIAPDESSACFGCMNLECNKGEGFITAENPLALPIETGHIVEVNAPGSGIFKQSLAVFAVPAICFFVGFILASLLFPQSEKGAVFAGILFLFSSIFVIVMIRAKIPAGKVFTVSRIIC